ncbi:MAG: hypothetical protein AAGA11_01805 [Pseudomonadota bacterium]
MLISSTTNRDRFPLSHNGRHRADKPVSLVATCRFALGYVMLVFDVWRERRALARLNAAGRADIGRNPRDIDLEARRSLFDLPAARLDALRCRVRRGR